jgi:ectoine hydroxylase-related dioxygenase (phytanoyl-CoA dioxygenase family)
MLSDKQVAEFDRNGCLIGGRVIDDADVDELRAELDRVIATHDANAWKPDEPQPVMISKWGEKEGSIIWQIVNIWEASPAFERLLYLPAVSEAISQLCHHGDIQIWHDQIQFKPPHHGGINNWHQDAPYWPVLKPETPVSAWIALDDVDESNGCMWMVPGSHRWGNHIKLLETNPQDDFFSLGKDFTPPSGTGIDKVNIIPWPVRKGEVSFHHSMTWHGSHVNKSDRPRRAIALHFMTGDARFVKSGQHPMKKFINLEDNASMRDAGPHFPQVCRGGKAVPAPQRIRRVPVM